MPKKNHFITEEYLERRLDERFAEQAGLIQQGFSDVQGQIGGLESRLGRVETKADGLEYKVDRLGTKFDHLEMRFDRLESKVDHLGVRIEEGFGKLDGFLGIVLRLDEAEAMNQAAHRRFEGRLTAMETRSSET